MSSMSTMSSLTPSNLLTYTSVKSWETQILELSQGLTATLLARPVDSSVAKILIDQLYEIYILGNTARLKLNRIDPKDISKKEEIERIITFIHNTKNKMEMTQEFISKENYSAASALISSIQYQKTLSDPKNWTLGHMINSTFEKIKTACSTERSPIHLQISEELFAITSEDPGALVAIQSATENLFMNAIKYAADSGPITLSMTKKDQILTIAIIDNEPIKTIPMDTLSRINKDDDEELLPRRTPFTEESPVSATGSWGMGLPSSFHLLRLFFGKAMLDQTININKTKTLSFSLPTMDNAFIISPSIIIASPYVSSVSLSVDTTPTPATETYSAPRSTLAVIMFEDENTSRRATKRLVSKNAPNATFYEYAKYEDANPEELEKIIRENNQVMILIDSTMAGGINGAEILDIIKMAPWYTENPEKFTLIWYSSYDKKDERLESLFAETRCLTSPAKHTAVSPDLLKRWHKSGSSSGSSETTPSAAEALLKTRPLNSNSPQSETPFKTPRDGEPAPLCSEVSATAVIAMRNSTAIHTMAYGVSTTYSSVATASASAPTSASTALVPVETPITPTKKISTAFMPTTPVQKPRPSLSAPTSPGKPSVATAIPDLSI